MLKKTLICVILLFFSFSASAPDTKVVYLPEIVVIGHSINHEIFNILVTGRDSVLVRNGTDTLYVDIGPVDTLLAYIIVAQAYHESGSFESELAVVHNNYYGMRHPGRGKLTTSLGPLARAEGRNGYAFYASVEDSVLDLMLLLEWYKQPIPSTVENYALFLKKHRYYEAPLNQYTKSLKYHLNHVDNAIHQPV